MAFYTYFVRIELVNLPLNKPNLLSGVNSFSSGMQAPWITFCPTNLRCFQDYLYSSLMASTLAWLYSSYWEASELVLSWNVSPTVFQLNASTCLWKEKKTNFPSQENSWRSGHLLWKNWQIDIRMILKNTRDVFSSWIRMDKVFATFK